MRPAADKRRGHAKLLIAIALILIAAATVLVLELTNTTYLFHKKNLVTQPVTPNRTGGQNTKGETGQTSGDQTPASTDGHNTKDNDTTQNTEFDAPTGNFVSNHSPNLSGQPAPNTIQSVCVTSPGATCTISFSKDGVTKSLPVQGTDKEGAAYWSWQLQDLKLTEGSWTITAKATLNGSTKTATDPNKLEIAK